MADGFDIHLDEARAQRLRAAADASGMDPVAYALNVIDEATRDQGWAEDEKRFAEYRRTGAFVDPDVWMQGLREKLERKFGP